MDIVPYKVSIITPNCYPLDKHRKIVLTNIAKQTHNNIELLIYNNGIKMDEHNRILNFIKSMNNNIVINSIHSLKRIGIGQARKILLKNSTGNYLIFIDSDDIVDKSIISQKLKLIEENKVDIVTSNARTFNELDEYTNNKFKYRNYFLYNKILKNKIFGLCKSGINLIPNSGTLIKKNALISQLMNNYPISKHEDFIFYKKLVERESKILISNKCMISYFINKDTFTGNKIKSRIWHYKILKKEFKYSSHKAFFSIVLGSIILVFIRLTEKININFSKKDLLIKI